MWSLDKDSNLPYYQQIINEIIQAIQKGELVPGDKLPPERNLAKLYGVNRSTVVRALEELVSFGWITRKQGSGTIVAEGRWGSRQLQTNQWRSLLASPFLKEDPYLTELKKHQDLPSHLDLFTGDLPEDLIPDFEFPAITWEQILQEKKQMTPTGYLPLKKAITKHLTKQLQLPTENQDLLITSGSTQGISLLMQILLETGDTIATEEYSFLFTLPLFASLGIRLIGIKQDAEGMIVTDLELAIQTKKIKLLYLNPNYQNPTGKTMSLTRRHEILALCKAYQLPIIEDDVFSDLKFADSLPNLKNIAPNQVIYLGSLSKLLSSSIKIGWLFAPRPLIESLANAKKGMENETDLFSQLFATAALTSQGYPQQQRKLLKQLKRRSHLFETHLTAFSDDWEFNPIQGGLYYWLTWKHQPLTRKDWNAFLEENLLVAPSFLFSNDTMAMRLNYTRIAPEQFNFFSKQLQNATIKMRKDKPNEHDHSIT